MKVFFYRLSRFTDQTMINGTRAPRPRAAASTKPNTARGSRSGAATENRLTELDLTEADIANAVAWARAPTPAKTRRQR